MDVRVHSLTTEYLESLENVFIQSHGNFDFQTDRVNFLRYIRLRSDLIKIAVSTSEIVGYIIGDQNNSLKPSVFSIYVYPSFRKQKIGSDLLRELEKEILTKQPNIRYFSVRIPETFFNSKNFFLKQGFDIITKINSYTKEEISFPYRTNSKVEIRPAKMSDLTDLVKLETTCFSDYWQKSIKEFRKEIESETNSLFAAFIEDKLVGYNSNTISANGIEGHYTRIATLPDFRKKHIATRLTFEAFQWFKKQQVQRILLTTFADSDIHNRMYRGWGFRFLEQELIMAKKYA